MMEIKRHQDNTITLKGLTLDQFMLINAVLGSNRSGRYENLINETDVSFTIYIPISDYAEEITGAKVGESRACYRKNADKVKEKWNEASNKPS